mmetsp:Transcript_44040/g.42624  ORF Transcript_44040/g.42624 Transcript_44040/m.42624 type:complete len:94 (+) Transcript_44040:1374-1655(+)
MKWGNVTITRKEAVDDRLTLFGKVDPNDKDFKKTKKLTWVSADEGTSVEVKLVEFDHLITKKKLEDNDEVKDFVNSKSKVEYSAIGEGSLRTL